MRSFLGASGALCLLLVAAGGARADDRKDIEALYARLKQAIVSNNPEATLALETPDFVSIGADGKKISGKQLAAEMKSQSTHSHPTKMDITIDSMNIKGKTASVSTSFSFAGMMTDSGGQMGPKGKKHIMGMDGKIHNNLVKTAQGWKFKTLEEKSGKMTLDGKPFDPSKLGRGPRK